MRRTRDELDLLDLLKAAQTAHNIAPGAHLRAQRSTRKGVPRYPFASTSMGGSVAQREELHGFLRRQGVPTEVNRQGDPIIRSLQHKRQVARALRMVDRDSFY